MTTEPLHTAQEKASRLTSALDRSLAIEKLCHSRGIICDWDKYASITTRWVYNRAHTQEMTFHLYMNGTEVATFTPDEVPETLRVKMPSSPYTQRLRAIHRSKS